MQTMFNSKERVRVYKQLNKGQIDREEAMRELRDLRIGGFKI